MPLAARTAPSAASRARVLEVARQAIERNLTRSCQGALDRSLSTLHRCAHLSVTAAWSSRAYGGAARSHASLTHAAVTVAQLVADPAFWMQNALNRVRFTSFCIQNAVKGEG
ncbi:MAG: hypothetical protein ACRDRC_01975 [Pseudonocardiaceae bacterium]